NLSKEIKHYKVNEGNYEIFVEKSVENIRKYIVAGVIKNLEINERKLKSIMNLQEKLHITHGRNRKKVAIGVHNLDVIKFPLYYKAVDPDNKFIPLNFDYELTLREILEKHEKGIKYKHIIEKFDKYPVIIDSNNKIISMPPIINADFTKVNENVRNLLIEVTGTNFYGVNKALNIIITSIVEDGGEIYSVKIID
ncbi:MAG: phenylalanine--tRNA ligase beta subunit-related protein, partial [Candidatus Altarchaeaceae archaeon]